MTAIQPVRLKEQASQLASNFDDPNIFIPQLHELLSRYSRHAYRPGQTGILKPILPSYKIPQPVLRQIELELTPYLKNDCQASIALCDALWQESFFEFKKLAATIIGKIPIDDPDIVLTRIHSWSHQIKDKTLSDTLFKQGLDHLMNKDPDIIISRAPNWLNNSQLIEKTFGIQLILATLENKDFNNLPLIYGLLAPFVRNAPMSLRSLIIEILLNLINRSPNETAYFLQQNIELSFDQDTAWFIRRCLNAFPPDIQQTLRAAPRKIEKQSKTNH